MTIKNCTPQLDFKTLAVLSILVVLTMVSPLAHAEDIKAGTGASAPIPSSSQQDFDPNKFAISSSSGADDKDVVFASPRVQEDPDAGSKVLSREKPVSYFKSDARLRYLPKH